jgi:hypothetical protein
MWALVELQKTMRLVALTPANGLRQELLLQQAQQLLPRLAN